MIRLWMGIEQAMILQRGHLLVWVPVCLAIGIGTYFSLGAEPGLGDYSRIGLFAAALAVLSRFMGEAWSPIPWAIYLVLLGMILAGSRAHRVGEPVLTWRYYGPVEGRVVAMDRSQSGALRLTLDQVRLQRVAPDKTPARVRISLHGKAQWGIVPEPGLQVMTTAHLSPPSGPVEPGGFDFQRHAWFARLGAVGYTRVPLLGAQPAQKGQAGLLIFRIRMAASSYIQEVLPGDIGGFAAALTTGDRSGVSKDTLEALRITNLAHLLAISGLHMGLLTAVVFAALRIGLAAVPWVALHWPCKVIAASGALIAAAGYLALSGGNVATQRAFIMVAVALIALILARRAISLRAVAVAAILVLVLRPEALTGPGFQMSFAATTALVAVFAALRRYEWSGIPKWAKPILAVVISSSVAGLATAPIAAAHFNTLAPYGLLANLLSVPLMGVLVIPAAVLALVLFPFGLDHLALWAMGLGLQWILGVAHWVAGFDGARGYVMGPGPWVLPLIAMGFLIVVLWQGRLRFAGLALVGFSFFLWHTAERPDVLISDTGTLVGRMTEKGRALSKAKGAGFVARNWLENDGSGLKQPEAAALWQAGTLVHLSGKRALQRFERCKKGQVVVVSVQAEDLAGQGCVLIDPTLLRKTGAIALWQKGGKWQVVTARDAGGDRMWNRWSGQGVEGRDLARRLAQMPVWE